MMFSVTGDLFLDVIDAHKEYVSIIVYIITHHITHEVVDKCYINPGIFYNWQ